MGDGIGLLCDGNRGSCLKETACAGCNGLWAFLVRGGRRPGWIWRYIRAVQADLVDSLKESRGDDKIDLADILGRN